MKKMLVFLCLMALLVGLAGCGQSQKAAAPETVNVYVLAGPTGVGSVNLWNKAEQQASALPYRFTLTAANDEVVAAISSGSADIAAVATNMAAALYNKTNGGVTVLAVNTTGVLSILTKETPINSVADLAGKTIYATGQGANPEYILRFVLTGNGLDPDADVTIRFVGGAEELAGGWQEDPTAVLLAPQPVATSLLMQNADAVKALDMTEEWNKIADDSALLMGCVIVRNEFLKTYPEAVNQFLEEYKTSIETALTDVQGTAALCEQFGIIPKAALAQKAIPSCGLTFLTGTDMKRDLSGYLKVMYEANPSSVGGKLPDDAFYYEAN